MKSNQNAFGFLAMGTAAAAMLIGCATVPTANPQATGDAASQATTLAPHEVLRDDRHLMVAGMPMTFEQIQAELPETLTEAQAARLLVTLDPSRVSLQAPANFTLQVYGRRGFHFSRGYYGGFNTRFHNFRYFSHRGYYFPYTRYGSFYRRYSYNNYFPFFYGYRNSFFPYYYNSCGGCGY